MNKTIWSSIVFIATILAVGWSIWAWQNYPLAYSGSAEIKQRCDEKNKSAYCYGFAAGYDWAWAQIQMDIDTAKRIANETIPTAKTPACEGVECLCLGMSDYDCEKHLESLQN